MQKQIKQVNILILEEDHRCVSEGLFKVQDPPGSKDRLSRFSRMSICTTNVIILPRILCL